VQPTLGYSASPQQINPIMHEQSQDVRNHQQAEQFSTTCLPVNAQHPVIPVVSPLLETQANNAGNTSSSPEK
jgi:hypothetical protein